MKITLVLITALGMLSPLAYSEDLTPGRWEMTLEMEAPGLPEQMRKRVQQDCLTPEQAVSPEAALKKSWRDDNCTSTDITRRGNTLRWSADCNMPGTQAKTHISGKMVVHDNKHYTTEMTVKGNNHSMKTRTEARWAGECEK